MVLYQNDFLSKSCKRGVFEDLPATGRCKAVRMQTYLKVVYAGFRFDEPVKSR